MWARVLQGSARVIAGFESTKLARALKSISVPRVLGPAVLLASARPALGAGLPGSGAAAHAIRSWSTAAGASAAVTTFQEMGLAGWLLVDLAINWAGWGLSCLLKTDKLYDMFGTGSFLVLAAGSLALNPPQTARKVLVSALVGVWAVRLGSYLVARVHKIGHDSRFDDVKHRPGVFLFYWTMQAVWVWVTSLPVLMINTAAAGRPLRWYDAFGVVLWGLGLAVEAVADAQKSTWRQDPAHKGRFINTGLWSLCRHPNYLGEMALWWGVFFTCVGGFTQLQQAASVASPLFVFLVLRYMSGIPIQDRQAQQRWANDPQYAAYRAATPLLLPRPSRVLAALAGSGGSGGAPGSSSSCSSKDVAQ